MGSGKSEERESCLGTEPFSTSDKSPQHQSGTLSIMGRVQGQTGRRPRHAQHPERTGQIAG